jgi:hypothetical protein
VRRFVWRTAAPSAPCSRSSPCRTKPSRSRAQAWTRQPRSGGTRPTATSSARPATLSFPTRRFGAQQPCGFRSTMRVVPAVEGAKCRPRVVSVWSRGGSRGRGPQGHPRTTLPTSRQGQATVRGRGCLDGRSGHLVRRPRGHACQPKTPVPLTPDDLRMILAASTASASPRRTRSRSSSSSNPGGLAQTRQAQMVARRGDRVKRAGRARGKPAAPACRTSSSPSPLPGSTGSTG